MMQSEEAAELEWLSNFVVDSYSYYPSSCCYPPGHGRRSEAAAAAFQQAERTWWWRGRLHQRHHWRAPVHPLRLREDASVAHGSPRTQDAVQCLRRPLQVRPPRARVPPGGEPHLRANAALQLAPQGHGASPPEGAHPSTRICFVFIIIVAVPRLRRFVVGFFFCKCDHRHIMQHSIRFDAWISSTI
jgi:hypothetical protein